MLSCKKSQQPESEWSEKRGKYSCHLFRSMAVLNQMAGTNINSSPWPAGQDCCSAVYLIVAGALCASSHTPIFGVESQLATHNFSRAGKVRISVMSKTRKIPEQHPKEGIWWFPHQEPDPVMSAEKRTSHSSCSLLLWAACRQATPFVTFHLRWQHISWYCWCNLKDLCLSVCSPKHVGKDYG